MQTNENEAQDKREKGSHSNATAATRAQKSLLNYPKDSPGRQNLQSGYRPTLKQCPTRYIGGSAARRRHATGVNQIVGEKQRTPSMLSKGFLYHTQGESGLNSSSAEVQQGDAPPVDARLRIITLALVAKHEWMKKPRSDWLFTRTLQDRLKEGSMTPTDK